MKKKSIDGRIINILKRDRMKVIRSRVCVNGREKRGYFIDTGLNCPLKEYFRKNCEVIEVFKLEDWLTEKE